MSILCLKSSNHELQRFNEEVRINQVDFTSSLSALRVHTHCYSVVYMDQDKENIFCSFIRLLWSPVGQFYLDVALHDVLLNHRVLIDLADRS